MENQLVPMKMLPSFMDYLWGGRRLLDEFGKVTDMYPVAESWEISCHPDAPSTVANGKFAGKSLTKVLEENPQFVGENFKGEFPILIKLIDAKQALSLQVHPNDEYSREHENQLGKNEMWYVMDAEPDAELIVGFKNEISKDEIRERIANNTILEVSNSIPVKAGDCFEIPAGMLHAIGGGTLVAEVQQSSNVTYRVYDFDRKDKDGNLRELHIDKAVDVLDTKLEAKNSDLSKSVEHDGYTTLALTDWEWFNCVKYSVNKEVKMNANQKSFHAVLVLDGKFDLVYNSEVINLNKGESVYVPAGAGEYKLVGKGSFLLTTI